jgi:hypothetical protein
LALAVAFSDREISLEFAAEMARLALLDQSVRVRHAGLIVCRKLAKQNAGLEDELRVLFELTKPIVEGLSEHPSNVIEGLHALPRISGGVTFSCCIIAFYIDRICGCRTGF